MSGLNGDDCAGRSLNASALFAHEPSRSQADTEAAIPPLMSELIEPSVKVQQPGALELLRALAPHGPWNVRTISSLGGSPQLPQKLGYQVGPDNAEDLQNGLCGWIGAAEAGLHNCYLHIAVGPPSKPKLSRLDVIGSRGVWVDVDPDPNRFDESRADILAAMRQEAPPFSCIVDSGNGYQAYKFIEPYRMDGNAALITELERRNYAISESMRVRLAGVGIKVDSCHSADHLMRLPGTTNCLTAKKRNKGYPEGDRPALIVEWHPECVYRLEELPSCSLPNEGSGPDKAETGSNGQQEGEIDWTKVEQHDGWLKSSEDLPPDFPNKGKIIVDHFGSLDDLCKTLIDAGLLQKKYKSWSEVTIALAAVFKQYGKHTPEQIAAALMCPLTCNEHITRQKAGDRERAVKNAFNHSHDKKPKAAMSSGTESNDVLDALNAEYFVVTQYEGKCRVAFFEETELKRKVLRLQSFQDFENAQGNKFICIGANQEGVPIMVPRGKWWATHKSRREYKSLVFAPHAGQVVDDKLNLWTGYGADVLDEWPADPAPRPVLRPLSRPS